MSRNPVVYFRRQFERQRRVVPFGTRSNVPLRQRRWPAAGMLYQTRAQEQTMTRIAPKLLTITLLLITAVAARAADDQGDSDNKSPHQGIMKGYIVRLDGTKLIFKDKAGPEVTADTSDSTQITLDGKKAALSDLKPGLFVQVLASADTAEKIIAKTPKK
jgi:hypothetical protein